MNKTRPSVYLVEKCQNLKTVLEFFLSSEGGAFARTANEKRAVFLSQIDFWDWEIEELCYAVNSFQERSKNWDDTSELIANLSKLNIVLRNAVLEGIEWNRHRREGRYAPETAKTVAPVEALNGVISKWNKLLKTCEETIMPKGLESAVQMGAQLLPNLDKYKKNERKPE